MLHKKTRATKNISNVDISFTSTIYNSKKTVLKITGDKLEVIEEEPDHFDHGDDF